METVFIYTLSDPITGEVRYIGKTKNYIRQRLCGHISSAKKSNKKSHKISWIKSLLNEGLKPIIEILDEVPSDSWEEYEIYWIDQFNQWGFNLTNLSIGGRGGNGFNHTEESKEKMSKSKKGVPLSEEHRKSISKSLKKSAKERPEIYEDRVIYHIDRDELYRKYITENLSIPKCAKYFGYSQGKIDSSLKKYGIEKDKSIWVKQCANNYTHPTKTILQYDRDMNLIKKWVGGLKEIEDVLGINRSMISRVCNGQRNHSKGFIWKYENDI